MTAIRNSKRGRWLAAIVAGLVAGVLASSLSGVLAQETTDGSHDHDTSTSETSTTSDAAACQLITESEAEAALGAPATAVPASSQCTYVADDASGRALAVAIPLGMPSAEHFASGMQQLAEVVGGTSEALSGVGDEAYAVIADPFSEVTARSGEAYVTVVLTGARGTRAEQTALLQDLATTAISRR